MNIIRGQGTGPIVTAGNIQEKQVVIGETGKTVETVYSLLLVVRIYFQGPSGIIEGVHSRVDQLGRHRLGIFLFLTELVATGGYIYVPFFLEGFIVGQKEVRIGLFKEHIVLPVVPQRETLGAKGPSPSPQVPIEIPSGPYHKVPIIIYFVIGTNIPVYPVLVLRVGILIDIEKRVVVIIVVVIELLQSFPSGHPVIPQTISIQLPAVPNEQVHDTFRTITKGRSIVAIGFYIIYVGIDR